MHHLYRFYTLAVMCTTNSVCLSCSSKESCKVWICIVMCTYCVCFVYIFLLLCTLPCIVYVVLHLCTFSCILLAGQCTPSGDPLSDPGVACRRKSSKHHQHLAGHRRSDQGTAEKRKRSNCCTLQVLYMYSISKYSSTS